MLFKEQNRNKCFWRKTCLGKCVLKKPETSKNLYFEQIYLSKVVSLMFSFQYKTKSYHGRSVEMNKSQ